jgi:predicted DCC family thiol-disulfide oxidoreductase YuxK
MAQSELGQALYRHYRLDPSEFETNLVIMDGRLYEKLAAFTEVMAALGWPWRALAALDALPRPVGDWLYDRIAQNRYRIFGRYDSCMAPSAELKARLIA